MLLKMKLFPGFNHSFRRGIYSAVRNIKYFQFSKYEKDYSLVTHRRYSLKPKYLHAPAKDHLYFAIIKLIKSSSNLKMEYQSLSPTNVYDMTDVALRLQTVITYSPHPKAKDVLILFQQYDKCSNQSLHPVLEKAQHFQTLRHKICYSLHTMNLEELHQFSLYLASLLTKTSRTAAFKYMSMDLSSECCERASVASLNDCITLLLILLEFHGKSLFYKNIYPQFLSLFHQHLPEANPLEVVNILHFVSMANTKFINDELVDLSLKLLIPSLKSLPFLHVGLACNDLFRLGIKENADSQFIITIAQKLRHWISNCNSKIDLLESFSITSMVKMLRISNHMDEELLDCMSAFIMKYSSHEVDPMFVSHMIAFYSNSSYYDKPTFIKFESFMHDYLSSNVKLLRMKDAAIVMWAFSNVLHHCKKEFITTFMECVEELSYTEDIRLNGAYFVDCVLAFVILGYFPKLLIHRTLSKEIFDALKEQRNNRSLSRFLLLHETSKHVSFENRPTFSLPSNLLPKHNITDEIKHRPSVNKIHNLIDWLTKELGGWPAMELQFLVPHINSCSLVFKKDFATAPKKMTDVGTIIFSQLCKLEGDIVFEIEDRASCLMKEFGGGIIGREHLKRVLLLNKGWSIYTISESQIFLCGEDRASLIASMLQILESGNRWCLNS